MLRRIISLLLLVIFLTPCASARAESLSVGFASVSVANGATVRVGDTVTLEISSTGAVRTQLMIVPPDSSRQGMDGPVCTVTLDAPGVWAFVAYAQDSSKNTVHSQQWRITADGDSQGSLPPALDPMITVSGLNTLFPASGLTSSLTAHVTDLTTLGSAQSGIADSNEHNPLYQLSTEFLKLAMNPITGTYDAVTGMAGAQEKEALERAIIEMLYGTEGDITTWNLSQYFSGRSEDELNSERAQAAGDAVGSISLGTEVTKVAVTSSHAYMANVSNQFDWAIQYVRRGLAYDPPTLLSDYSVKDLDHLMEEVREVRTVTGADPERADLVLRDLEKYRNVKSGKTPETFEKIGNGLTVLSIVLDAASLYFDLYNTWSEASRANDALRQKESVSILGIADEILSKVEILDCLLQELDENTPLYGACRTVRDDLMNGFHGLHSTETRRAISETGKYVLDFSCKTTLNLVALFGSGTAKAAAGTASLYLGAAVLGAHGANFLNGGLTEDMNSLSEATENLLFIHNALLTIRTDRMSYYMTELYYTLAKKRLDYITQRNYFMHQDYWWSDSNTGTNEYKMFSAEYQIASEQGFLLSLQNGVREDVFDQAGAPTSFPNRYYSHALPGYAFYLLHRFDVTLGSSWLWTYHFVPLLQTRTNLLPAPTLKSDIEGVPGFATVSLPLTKEEACEILFTVMIGGKEYCFAASGSGRTFLVRASEIQDLEHILESKYHFQSGSTGFDRYRLSDTQPVQDGTVTGRFDVQYCRTFDNGVFYKVRDESGAYCYLSVDEVQKHLKRTGQIFSIR